MSKKIKQAPPADAKPGDSIMTLEQIQSEYAQKCTILGDITYKFELQKAQINSRLLELNQIHSTMKPPTKEETPKAAQAAQ